MVGIGDVQTAAREMFNSILHLAVSHATSYQALLFIALASLQRNSGRERGGFTTAEVHTKMESMANSFGSRKYLPCPQYHMILGMLCPLGEVSSTKPSTNHDISPCTYPSSKNIGRHTETINSERDQRCIWDQRGGYIDFFEHGCF